MQCNLAFIRYGESNSSVLCSFCGLRVPAERVHRGGVKRIGGVKSGARISVKSRGFRMAGW